MKRRAFFRTAAALAGSFGVARAKTPESRELRAHALELDGDKRIARQALVLEPARLEKGARPPVLVLLHGLGETGNPELGLRAWSELYGLIESYERLRHPPVKRMLAHAKYFDDDELAHVNSALDSRPFRGLVAVCPVTPNPQKSGISPARALDVFADWIEKTLLPAVYDRVTCARGTASTGLDGCSLGGYVAAEVFSRKPELFGTLGGVQAAINVTSAERYAKRIAEIDKAHGPRRVHVETSTQDPFQKANRAWAKKLTALGVATDYAIYPGPHNQPWLREVGTLEMLLWHDAHLR